MRVIRPGEVAAGSYGGSFTGAVEIEMLEPAADDARPDIARVSFADGAATYWHSHPGGQTLLVLEGTGAVGTEADGELELEPGAVVIAPADERHWHGAAVGSSCRWLTITWGATSWDDQAPR